jgi:hypothetical protein
MLTRFQSTFSKHGRTKYLKNQKKNNFIKKLIFTHKNILQVYADDDKLSSRYRNNPDDLFLQFVSIFIEISKANILEYEKEIEICEEIYTIFTMDHRLKQRRLSFYNYVYSKIYEDFLKKQKEKEELEKERKKLEKKYKFSVQKLIGPDSNAFIKNVENFLFTNGNNEFMTYEIYEDLLKQSRDVREKYRQFLVLKQGVFGLNVTDEEIESSIKYK